MEYSKVIELLLEQNLKSLEFYKQEYKYCLENELAKNDINSTNINNMIYYLVSIGYNINKYESYIQSLKDLKSFKDALK